jgi:hypothetical protein
VRGMLAFEGNLSNHQVFRQLCFLDSAEFNQTGQCPSASYSNITSVFL